MSGLRYGVIFPGKQRVFSLLDNAETALGTTQLPTQWVSGVLLIGLKLPEREANLCRLWWRYVHFHVRVNDLSSIAQGQIGEIL
jgi:hypothetical protein